jgi:riboflavin kinase/FMN adenylyltransferase
MQRLDGGASIPSHLADGIVALGNFDGFHLGHQAVVARAIAWAKAEGGPALVATFDPHPVRHFRPDTSASGCSRRLVRTRWWCSISTAISPR